MQQSPINAFGQVVGFADTKGDLVNGQLGFQPEAFSWQEGKGTKRLGYLANDIYSEALDVNAEGVIVGVSYDPNFHGTAFVYKDDVMTDLNCLLPANSGVYITLANGINDLGEISGAACVVSDGTCSSMVPAVVLLPQRGGQNSCTATGPSAQPSMSAELRMRMLRQSGVVSAFTGRALVR